MSNLVLGDVLQVTYKGELAGQTILTVLHARCDVLANSNEPIESVCYDLAAKFADPTDTRLVAMLACVGPEYQIKGVKVQRIKPLRSIGVYVAGGGPGTFAGNSKTPNIAASIEKQSVTPDRKGVGRIQLAGIPTSVYTAGVLDPTYIAGPLTTYANLMFGGFSGGTAYPTDGYRWCLPAAGGLSSAYDVWSCVIQDTVRTMHRRTVRVGI